MSDLDPLRIEAELERLGASIGRPVVVASVTASTNDDARRAAAGGAPHGSAFLADAQTQGRGRSGHRWHSPAGENLYLSVVLRPKLAPQALPPLALVLGVCVARVVDEVLGSSATSVAHAGVKWPNDVLVDGKKLAGLLVETALRGGKIDAVIAGIGLNVHAASFPEELAPRATSLHALGGRSLDRSSIAARLLAEIGHVARMFEAHGLGPFLAELEDRDVLRGVPLDVSGVSGTAAGIDPEGYLRVIGSDGTKHRIGSGSVTTHGPLGSPGARIRRGPGAGEAAG
ncbi:biotin--[acetyl-CoA-carboxylase] ligase [Polyangium sorediatum]|uniref:biotin--[biotin carboxyl-carrier protein] ligase n=1 Tax=Polyangium sorediatum TaxID=889274 RepID=A0ABT6NQE4_9BACT|nr:biotin--[acetyl-CoA-carboxylase] ligase [Polyangium sorediatum]MDI1430545.1 biotin--[acetyl-CoA-carboxylase] ligase [Polyangium sorediatum]